MAYQAPATGAPERLPATFKLLKKKILIKT